MDKLAQTNLLALLAAKPESGPLWATESEDLNSTYVAWEDGQGVVAHQNAEVDVIMIVISGNGKLTLDGQEETLQEGQVILIPKGTERGIRATGGRLAYLNVHKRRKRLMPGDLANRP